jgi:golgi-specific brefeldin A-resistance guanine nucleotide exchange factor 1
MANGKYLVPPPEDPSKEKLWVETRKRLERFLPNLFEEVFPTPNEGAGGPDAGPREGGE